MTDSKRAKKRGLGRGLSALISSSAVPTEPPANEKVIDKLETETPKLQAVPDQRTPSPKSSGGSSVPDSSPSSDGATISERVRYVKTELLVRNENQPRQFFKQEEIDELASSIKTLGVLQAILVRPLDSEKKYEIVAGERRWRASKAAGLSQVPVIIRNLSDLETLEISIVENVQRSDLSVVEEARAYQRLADEFSLTQKEIAEKVGKDRASIANTLRLLSLPDEVLVMVSDKEISMGHAKVILSVKEPAVQTRLARKVLSEGLSVRALEEIVSRSVNLAAKRKPKGKGNVALGSDTNFPEVLERLRRKLGTKVNVHHHPSGRGKIEIQYFSEGELDRLVEAICG